MPKLFVCGHHHRLHSAIGPSGSRGQFDAILLVSPAALVGTAMVASRP